MQGVWVPDRVRGACHRAGQRPDPLAYLSGTTVDSRHTPKLLSRQRPPASRQFSFTSSTGGPQLKGSRSKFSARQSPSSQSPLVCHSGNVVAISHVAPERWKLATARSIFANDRCTRASRHRIASHLGSESRVISARRYSPLISPVAARAFRCSISGGTISTPRRRPVQFSLLILP